MMTFEDFERLAGEEPGLAETLNKAAAAAGRTRQAPGTFEPVTTMAGMAALVILFPIVNRIVQKVGLPWVESVGRYSEMWRAEFERWMDEQHENHGFDPVATKAASETLLHELEGTTDDAAREPWERLMGLVRK